MPVNQENVKLLITELRKRNPDGTPVYRKGKGYNHRVIEDEDYWCCLGVANHVASQHVSIPREMSENYQDIIHEVFDGNNQVEVLCDQAREFFGFNDHNPYLENPFGTSIPAAEWNDYGDEGEGGSSVAEDDFDAIADGFERTYLDAQ